MGSVAKLVLVLAGAMDADAEPVRQDLVEPLLDERRTLARIGR